MGGDSESGVIVIGSVGNSLGNGGSSRVIATVVVAGEWCSGNSGSSGSSRVVAVTGLG